MGQSVEEPDADDDSADVPDNPPVPAARAPEAPAPKPDIPLPQAAGTEGNADYDGVMLRVLNKVTARAQTVEAPIGSVVRSGTIEIVAHRCWKSAPDERPENAALIEVSEIKQGEAPTQIFLGWMFSSSPGISALEHPFYDVTVVKCEKSQAEAPPAAPVKPAGKKAKQ